MTPRLYLDEDSLDQALIRALKARGLDVIDHALPMADAMILATAVSHDATLWTQDQHFDIGT